MGKGDAQEHDRAASLANLVHAADSCSRKKLLDNAISVM
jgi:hypothetical protein